MRAPAAETGHRQLRQLVADRLRADILEGKLPPGSWVRQEQIAQEMKVSQMPVREALRELTAEGLVVHEPYRGVRVTSVSPDDAEDLYASRAAIEALAARAAASNVTDAELSELRELAARMEKRLAPRHIVEYRELNRRFHGLVTAASRRPFLIRTVEQLWSAFPTMLLGKFEEAAAASIPERDERDVAEHQEIVDALARRDGAAAERAVRDHLEATSRHLVAALRNEAPPPEMKPAASRRKS